MGMDVYGKSPSAEVGEYFRNNCWWWRPLWIYCETVAPELTDKVAYAQSNDGDGLNAKDSIALAGKLRAAIERGDAERYAQEYKQRLEELPDIECQTCDGTGKRKDPPEIGAGRVRCNGCDGKGTRRPPDTYYPFSTDNVKNFANFLEHSGGFEIC